MSNTIWQDSPRTRRLLRKWERAAIACVQRKTDLITLVEETLAVGSSIEKNTPLDVIKDERAKMLGALSYSFSLTRTAIDDLCEMLPEKSDAAQKRRMLEKTLFSHRDLDVARSLGISGSYGDLLIDYIYAHVQSEIPSDKRLEPEVATRDQLRECVKETRAQYAPLSNHL